MVKIFQMAPLETEEENNGKNIKKPEQIGDDKNFAKWNPIINNTVDIYKRNVIPGFQPLETVQVNRTIQNKENMLVPIKKCLPIHNKSFQN